MLPQVPANVYVKKTALGQQTIDISGLEAPQDAPGGKADSAGEGSCSESQTSQSSSCGSQGSTDTLNGSGGGEVLARCAEGCPVAGLQQRRISDTTDHSVGLELPDQPQPALLVEPAVT